MDKVAITGISGFVGSNLSLELSKTYKVLGISRSARIEKKIYSYDDSESLLNKSQIFIHLAGKAHDLKKISNDSEYFEANTELTKILYDQFIESDCEIFIFMSSVKAVADSVDHILYENVIPNPLTAYGKSKLEAENYILSKKIPSWKKFYILRPCMIHGPKNKGNLNLLYSFVKRGLPYPFGSYHNERSFLSINNLNFVIKELLNVNIESGIYNISDDSFISSVELIKLISQSVNKPTRILNVPKNIIIRLAKLGDIFRLPISTERVNKLTENYKVSNEKIKKAISKELPYTASEGLKMTFKSFNLK